MEEFLSNPLPGTIKARSIFGLRFGRKKMKQSADALKEGRYKKFSNADDNSNRPF